MVFFNLHNSVTLRWKSYIHLDRTQHGAISLLIIVLGQPKRYSLSEKKTCQKQVFNALPELISQRLAFPSPPLKLNPTLLTLNPGERQPQLQHLSLLYFVSLLVFPPHSLPPIYST